MCSLITDYRSRKGRVTRADRRDRIWCGLVLDTVFDSKPSYGASEAAPVSRTDRFIDIGGRRRAASVRPTRAPVIESAADVPECQVEIEEPCGKCQEDRIPTLFRRAMSGYECLAGVYLN